MQELCVHTISCVFEACKDFYHLNFCQVETEYKVKSGWNFESIFILFLILKNKSKRDLKDACAILHDLYFHWWCQWRCFGSNHYVYNDDNCWVSSIKVKPVFCCSHEFVCVNLQIFGLFHQSCNYRSIIRHKDLLWIIGLKCLTAPHKLYFVFDR